MGMEKLWSDVGEVLWINMGLYHHKTEKAKAYSDSLWFWRLCYLELCLQHLHDYITSFQEHTALEMKFSMKCTADLVTFTEEILNGKLHFMCSDMFRAENKHRS